MQRQLRTVFISRLVPNIRALPGGGSFEAFGHRFLVHWLRLAMVNQGLNLLQDPVPGVVDSVSVDGNTAGEYSAEKTYFSGRMRKAFKDLRHALEHQPQASRIILVTSQDAPPQKLEPVKRRMARVLMKHGKTVDIMDAQRVAEAIVDDLLLSDLAVDELGEFLPELQRIAEEHASSHMTPSASAKHVARPETDLLINDAFERSSCVVLAGVGGSGKTDAAAAFARARSGTLDLLIWLDARDLSQINELASMPLIRGGAERNILSLLQDRRCLLVLDDLEANIPVADLSAICGSHSRVLVTRRNKLEPSHLAMPAMDEGQARELLDGGLELSCPDDACRHILASVGGHPFTLAIINAAIRNGAASWEEIVEDCQDLGGLGDGAHERVADRVLARIEPRVRKELEVFVWLNGSICDSAFLRRDCGPKGRRLLDQNLLTSTDKDRVVRLHDIVFASAKSRIALSSERASVLSTSLDTFLKETAASDDIAFTAASFTLANKIEALVISGDHRSGLVYGLLRAWPMGRAMDLVGDPIALAAEIKDGGDPFAIACVLEIIEWNFRSKVKDDAAAARAWLEARLRVFDDLDRLPCLTDRSRAEILHHRGKALRFLGREEEAIAAFEGVLSGPCPLHEARLQLLRAANKQKDDARAIALGEAVLSAALEDERSVTNSALLAVAEAIPWSRLSPEKRADLSRYEDLIESAIAKAISAGSDQSYQAFGAMGRQWSWRDPQRLRRVYELLPPRSLAEMPTNGERFTYADILREAAEGAGYDAEERQRLRADSVILFESMTHQSDYQRTRHGRLLVEMQRFDEAIEKLSFEAKGGKEFQLYWLSKALLGAGLADEALAAIEEAIKIAPAGSNFQSTFLSQRFETRHSKKDLDALEDLDEAIARAEDKHRRALEERRAEVTGRREAS